MKVFIHTISILLLAALCLPVIFINGCGSDTSISAPSGSTITLSPESVSWASGFTGLGCQTTTALDNTTFAITVLDSTGSQMNDAVIFVELDLSPGTASTAIQCLTLIDADTGAVVTSPYRTTTGDFGTKNMRVTVNLGAEYKANLRVFSGTAFGNASIEVTKQ